MDIKNINRILHALRTGVAWSLPDEDLRVIESDDEDVWPLVNYPPNYGEPFLQQYVPRIGTEPGVSWSAITAAIRKRRPVTALRANAAVIAAQPAPVIDEADPEIARLQKELVEAEENVRQGQAKPAAPPPGFAPVKEASVTPAVTLPTPVPPMPPMLPRAEQAVTKNGRRWAEVVNDLRSLGSNGKLPTRATFEKWIERNGLDTL